MAKWVHAAMLKGKGGEKLFGMRGRGMGMSGSSTTRGNKMWVGMKMGLSKLFKSLSHIVSIQLNISLL